MFRDIVMQEDWQAVKARVKSKICIIRMVPNYPMGAFAEWVTAQNLEIAPLVDMLDIIQMDLDADETALRHTKNKTPSQLRLHALYGYWCLYCSQIRAYYKAILRDPHCKRRLSFLL